MRLDADTLIAAALRERPMVYAQVKRRVGEAFAEDVTQDVFVRAVSLIRRDRLVVEEGTDVRDAIRGWLTLVLRNVCGDRLRRETSGWARAEQVDVSLMPAHDPVPVLESRDELRAVGRALTKWYRPVLARVARGETIAEIAAALGIPDGTVAERTRQARRVLRQRRNRER